MTLISLQLPGEELKLSTKYAEYLHLSRAEYIREAIRQKNLQVTKELRDKRMAEASRKVREESMRVNAEFAAFEEDPNV